MPAYIHRVISSYKPPKPWINLAFIEGVRPFRVGIPAIAEFPSELWGRIAAGRARNFRSCLRKGVIGAGMAIARCNRRVFAYVPRRAMHCRTNRSSSPEYNRRFDLLSRLLLKKSDPDMDGRSWIFRRPTAFDNAGARIIAVPVNEEGSSVSAGVKICAHARGVYVTPGHQFPLGVTMSLERRMAVLRWASRTGAFVIEDDYDSEYSFEGPPVPALQSLDNRSNVIFIGSFSKTLFSASAWLRGIACAIRFTFSCAFATEPISGIQPLTRRCSATSSSMGIWRVTCDECAICMRRASKL